MIDFLSQYISYWPFVVFCALLLAGFNLPVSEDAIIIVSATLAQDDCTLLVPSYIAIYAGIIGSDIISYFFGFFLSRGLLNVPSIRRKLTPEKIRWVSGKLEKHGLMTYIVVRFVPFGLRNALFMSSGFIGLPFKKFVLFDVIAATISSFTLYSLVYLIGASGNMVVKIIGVVVLAGIAVAVAIFIRNANRAMATDSYKNDTMSENIQYNGKEKE